MQFISYSCPCILLHKPLTANPNSHPVIRMSYQKLKCSRNLLNIAMINRNSFFVFTENSGYAGVFGAYDSVLRAFALRVLGVVDVHRQVRAVLLREIEAFLVD